MKKSFFILMPLFLYAMSLHEGLDYFFEQRYGVMLVAVGLTSWAVSKKYGYLVGAISGTLLFSVARVVFHHSNAFVGMGEMRPIIHRGALLGTFSTLLMIAAVWLKPIRRDLMSQLFVSFGVMICVHAWILSHWWQPEGFLMTPTLAAIYLILVLPLCGVSWISCLFALTVLKSGGHGAMLALAAYMTGCLWVNSPKWLTAWFISLGTVGGLMWWVRGTGWLFRDHGRMVVWKTVMKWWWESGHWFLGMGTGTWYSLGPWIQQKENVPSGGYYIYAHNELIEILFTLGVWGLGLFLAFWMVSVLRAKLSGNAQMVGFLFALAASSISMFPLRNESCLFVVLFVLHDLLENQFRRVRI